jgi:DNA-binding FrmR family transcriptional regulator
MTDEASTKIINRLRSIKGHVQGVENMVEEGAYCIDVLNQIFAIQAALHKVSGLVLDRHLHTCVTTAMRSDDATERERVITEMMALFETKNK